MDHGKHGEHGNLLFADETFRIRGAVFEVYRTMGPGFLEAVYQECLAIEFAERRIPFVAMQPLHIEYQGRKLRKSYTPDFVCFDRVVLELKVAREIAPEHRAQTLNYLRATGLRLGLLINFGATPEVKIERFAL
ncbi:GxxExxY protein [Phenylobacterium sp.]|jgi:GxxExxY protein|uniref:GxxExxY protein n=1 Tax=Phenylobacterium sp. TaxID=1871053 RepID=UPI002F95804B